MTKYLLIAILTGVTVTCNSQTLKDAIRLNENEQHEAASGVYLQLISKEPNNGNNYYYYGENLIDADKPDSAKLIFDKGLQMDAANPINKIGLAELKLMQGNMAEAKIIVDNALVQGNNKNSILLLEAAEAYIKYTKKDLLSAIALLDQAAKMEPKNPEIYNLLGDAYSEQNNGTLAASNYNKALELDKNQVKAYLHKGQLYKRSTNYEGATVEFQSAVTIDPDFAPAYRELAEVSFKLKKMDEAKEYYKKYLALSKNNINARLRYAFFLYDGNEYIDASKELDQITKADSSNVGMMRVMAYVYYEAGKNDTAFRAIKKVFENTESDTSRRISRDYSYYGKIIAKAGNDSLGAEYIRSAIRMSPKQMELYDDLIEMYMRIKDFGNVALTYQDKINNVFKPAVLDYFNLGKAWYSAKNYYSADSAFIKVTELSPGWPTGYFWRGRSNSLIDSTAKNGLAAPHYEKFLELASSDSVYTLKNKNYIIEANKSLAFAAFVMKDCVKSIAYFSKVLELDPMDKQAKESIESIKKSKDCK